MEGTLSGKRGARARAELAASDPVMAELVDRLGDWSIGDVIPRWKPVKEAGECTT